jgi:DNA-binding FrmR family transcriptional regulator
MSNKKEFSVKKVDHQRAKLLNRVKRIKGQVEAVERALSDDHEECADTLQLLAACRGAINGLMGEVLEGHIKDHIAGEKPSREVTDDLIEIVRAYLK